MKKLIVEVFVCMLLMSTFFVIVPNAVSADEYWLQYYYTAWQGKATITGYSGPGGDITIPSIVGMEMYPVVAINDSAFDSESGHKITSVIIPDSVETIGIRAFRSCSDMTSVTLGNNVTSIGNQSFRDTALTSVVIPNSVDTIKDGAFSGTALTSVIIPDSVTTLGSNTFSDCSSLSSVTIGNGITTINWGTFIRCTALTSVIIPNNVNTIEWDAFYQCSSLNSVVIGNNVNTIGYAAFSYCNQLTSVIIPDSVTTIGDEAFHSCQSLISVTIGNGVKTIGNDAFRGCFALNMLIMGKSVESIRDNSFGACQSLHEVAIPNSVNTIGNETFRNSGLTSINIPNSVTTLGTSVFENCYYLTNVTIGNAIKTVDDSSFLGCRSLLSVTIPNGVTTIGNGTFWGCEKMTSVIVGNKVTTIGDHAFDGCNSLTSIIFLGFIAPTNIGQDWIRYIPDEARGHAFPDSNFPDPDGPEREFHNLTMGTRISKLTLTTSGTGKGTIESSPSGLYPYYESAVTIWANASSGSTFTGFTGDLTNKTSPATLYINGNKSVTAVFTKTSSGGNGGDGGDGEETPNTPPTANYSYSPSTPTINETIQFTDTSVDSDGTIASWLWTFGDGTTSTIKNPKHNYTASGQYTITLDVTDNEGAKKSISKILTISQSEQPNNQPTADFTLTPTTAKTNETIQFTDTSQDTDGTITSYLWSFGDGTTSTNQNPEHRYMTNGTFSITLEITDNDGATNEITNTIVINNEGTEPDGNNGIPGFELIIIISAIAIAMFLWKKKRKI